MSDLHKTLEEISLYADFDSNWPATDAQISQYAKDHDLAIPKEVQQILKKLGGGNYDLGASYFNISKDSKTNLASAQSLISDPDLFIFGRTGDEHILAIRHSNGRILELSEGNSVQEWDSMSDYLSYELAEDHKWREPHGN